MEVARVEVKKPMFNFMIAHNHRRRASRKSVGEVPGSDTCHFSVYRNLQSIQRIPGWIRHDLGPHAVALRQGVAP